MSAVAKGEILSQNPNVTNASKRKPNLGMTIPGALQRECCWSKPYKEHAAAASEARTNNNGHVKIEMKGALLNAFEDEELNRILLVACKAHVNQDINTIEEIKEDPGVETFLMKMAPVILKYVHAKVKLFVKHIIHPLTEAI